MSEPEDINQKDVFIDDLKKGFDNLKIEKYKSSNQKIIKVVEKETGVKRAVERTDSDSWESFEDSSEKEFD